MNIFNTVEVIDMGIEQEKKRRDFYGLAADKFTDEKIRELFTRLKEWEEIHIKKFTEIRNGVQEFETTPSYSGELEDYMNSLVDDRLYGKVSVSEFSKNIKTPLSAVSYALGFEKDAILFFGEIMPYVDEANKDKIEELISEEKKHVIYLTQLKRELEDK